MPTFLALQCYKCSMMQVKHHKVSSSKWSCSVCNEKQSVRKVFATSAAAKDIRKFVQDYNLSRNSAQDRVLAELVQKADEECDVGFMGDSALSFNSFGDELSQHHVKRESKWTEYISPEEEELYAEICEGPLVESKFVTSIPENLSRKTKGRVQAAVEEQDERPSLQQQGLSFTRGKHGKLSNKSIKSFPECHADTQKENELPSLWATKTTSNSWLHVQKTASMHCRKQPIGCKVPQETIAADVPLHRRKGIDSNRERVLVQANVERKSNIASKKPEISRGNKEEPLSKWATYLDFTENVTDQRACTIAEEEKHVSKWAKYMDLNEVKPGGKAMQNSVPAAKWESFLDASDEMFPKQGQSLRSSSVWSLKASSNLQCLNSVGKTELDELFNTSHIAEEVDEEVHSLFL